MNSTNKSQFFTDFACYNLNPLGCLFEAVPSSQCPSNPIDLTECDVSMATGEFCRANKALPDGNIDFDINNCHHSYDVFRCTRGNNTRLFISNT